MSAEVVAADQLLEHEAIIERGLGSFLEVGAALVAIRDGKLYRATHSTFEAYCSDRWQIPRNHAYRLIDAAQAVQALSPIGDIPVPATESQAREIVGLPPDVAAEVMTAAADSGKVTAASIKAARDVIAPPVVKVTETVKTESFIDTATGEIVPPDQFRDATKMVATEAEPSWKQNLRAQRERKDRDRAAEKAIEQFPELAYYLAKPDVDKALELAAQLRTYSGVELDKRRAILARSIEADKAGVFDRAAQAVDYLTPAQDVFFAFNAVSQLASSADAANAIAAAVDHGADPALVETWRRQFTDLAGLCSDLAAACQPRLRSVR